MYSDVVSVFLNNIRALRFYVDSVETNMKTYLDREPSGDVDEIYGFLMYLAMKIRKHGTSIDRLKFSDEMPEELVTHLKDTISRLSEMIQEKTVDDKKIYQFPFVSRRVKEEYQRVDIEKRQEEILYSGSLMLLVTYFENLVAGVFKKDFVKHPQRVSLETKSVSYKLLSEVSDVEEIKNILIDQEVTDKMYGSLVDWKTFFQKQLKLEVKGWEDNLEILQEIIARRNLYVHNNGIINNLYVNITGSNRDFIGKSIGIKRQYIDKAIDLIEYIGVSLVIEVWVKEYATDEKEVTSITKMIYEEYLITERWELAKKFYEICLQSKKLCSADKVICQINRWQCFKWLGEYDKIKDEIDKEDLSAYKPMYILGVYALQEKYHLFFEMYDKQNDIGEMELREWPLFKGLRESKEYKERFPDIEYKEKEDQIEEIKCENTEEVIN